MTGALIFPVIVLLALGIVSAVLSRAVRASPIVGYLLLGLLLHAARYGPVTGSPAVAELAQLGVVFLLFDIGLHFSLRRLREQAGDIFGFGPVQVVGGGAVLGALGCAVGLAPFPAFLVGTTLALSSTAVVARVIAERHQQNCPVGLTATAILIFQDIAAIFVLIVAGAMNTPGSPALAAGAAVVKAGAAFLATVLLARFAVSRFFGLLAATRNEEVFTASAVLVALAAGGASGAVGLSLTLGAFLGGVMLADTPYRPVIQSEIKPFRGLLLGFFFITVGASLDLGVLGRHWLDALGLGAGLVLVKIATNAAASLLFRWSVPGSLQLGFLLAQGSEFAFVILALPAVRAAIGETRAELLIAAIAITLAATPSLATAGRWLAGRLRSRNEARRAAELAPRGATAPVFIVGMGRRGRAVADALRQFGIAYDAIERDEARLRIAIADGYDAVFGDIADTRIWEPVAMEGRRLSVLTAPVFEVSRDMTAVAERRFPHLVRIAAVRDENEAARFAGAGLVPVVDRGDALVREVLLRLGVSAEAAADWQSEARGREAEPV